MHLIVRKDGAEVITLGCAGRSGYRTALQAELEVSAADLVQAGATLACIPLDPQHGKKMS